VPSLPSLPSLTAALAILMMAAPARAEEPPCPLDMFEAAGGTWSTLIAESINECLADPACAGEAGMAPRPPPPPPPSGRFADLGATIGVLSDTRASDGEARTRDAWVVGSGAINAGWRGGPKACASGRGALGTGSQVESNLGVAFPWTFVSVMLGGSQRWHVRPELSSPRIWLRRAFIENHIYAQMAFAVWRHADGGVSAVVPARIETTYRRQLDGPQDPGVSQRVAFSIYEHAGAVTRVEVLRFALDSFYPDGIPPETVPDDMTRRPPISVMRFDPLVLATRAGGYELELAAGLLSPSDPLDCRGCVPVTGKVGVGTTRGDDTWHARYDRDAYLAIDARVVVEDRATVRFRHALGRHAVRIDGFAALTRTTAMTERDPVATGGVTVGLDAALPEGVQLAVDLEAGRSYYARLEGDPAPVAERVARIGVALSRSFGN
jgi:hypothetical protein